MVEGAGMTFAARTLMGVDTGLIDYNDLTVLLHMNGSNGSTAFTNSIAGASFSAYGNAKISTARSQFGGASCLLDGTGDYLFAAYNSAIDLLGGSFIVSAHIYYPSPLNASYDRRIFSTGGGAVAWNSSNGIHLLCQINGGYSSAPQKANIQFYTSSGVVGLSSSNSINLDAWNHVLFQYSAVEGKVYVGVNGTLTFATPSSAPSRPSTNPQCAIGTIPGEGGSSGPAWNGNIDELAVAKVAPVSGSTYEVPSAPF